MTTVLVTGGKGFIGNRLVNALRKSVLKLIHWMMNIFLNHPGEKF